MEITVGERGMGKIRCDGMRGVLGLRYGRPVGEWGILLICAKDKIY